MSGQGSGSLFTGRAAADREGFALHAAPEAIKAEMDRLRRKQTEIQRQLEKLEALYIRRVSEKEAGHWPAMPA